MATGKDGQRAGYCASSGGCHTINPAVNFAPNTTTFYQMKNRKLQPALPTVRWVRANLRYNPSFAVRIKVLRAFVIGSVAKGTEQTTSDLDIAVVIPPKHRVSALNITEKYHFRMGMTNSSYPIFNGKRVDFQFFFPDDKNLATYPAIKLT